MTMVHNARQLARRTAQHQTLSTDSSSTSIYSSSRSRPGYRFSEVMDPFSFAASVGSLSGACIFTVKRLGEVAAKLKDAPKIIQDVASEAKIITISLSLLHNILVSDEHTILAQALLTPDIRSALDIALTGCSVTLSCIKNEIHSLTVKIDAEQKLNFADRAKVVLKDNKFNELLQQLRRQHNAIAILQQGLQMKALADIIPLLKSNRLVIQKVAEGTESLRGLYPEVNAAKSFLESFESPNRDEPTFSIVSERQFEFDDVVTNSQAYRRVLVAATHTLRTRHSGNVLANGDVNDPGHNEANDLGTQGANQARKISAAAPSRSAIPSPNKVSQNGLNRRTTISDPVNFVQQLRGYVDQVEGELMSATDETMQLREMMEEKGRLIQGLENHLQTSAAQFKNIEWQLRQEMQDRKAMLDKQVDKMRAAHREEVNFLQEEIVTGEMELKDRIEKEMVAKEHLKAEMEAQHKSDVIYLDTLLQKTKDELQSTTEKLHATQKEKDSAHEGLIAEKRGLEARLHDYTHHCDELETVYRKLRQELTAECKRLVQKSRNTEESFQKGNATQFGSILLVPFQSPAWLGGQGKVPHIWEAFDAPETPEGWETQWDDQQKKWSFVNQHTKETQFEKPTSPAAKPPKLPETPGHTPTSSSVSSSAELIAKLSNEKPKGASGTQASPAVPRTDSTTGSSNENRRGTTTSPIGQGPVIYPAGAGSGSKGRRATTTNPTEHVEFSPKFSENKKRKSKLPFT